MNRIPVLASGFSGKRILLGGGLLATAAGGLALYRFLNNEQPDAMLSRLRFTPLQLESSTPLSHDVKRLRFAFDNDKRLGYDVSSAVLFRVLGRDGVQKSEWRPYTPVSPAGQRGWCEIVVKRYDKGLVSPAMHELRPGDVVEVWGPLPFLEYCAGSFDRVGLIAGGSGITPCLQLARCIVENPEDHTKVTLLFANKTVDDVILKDELDGLAARYPDKFAVHYIVDKQPPNGNSELQVGRVDRAVVERVMPAANELTFIGVCGPPAMVTAVSGERPGPIAQGKIGGVLKELGYSNVFKF
ncbi:NADH-cytochrome b5 reductase [Coemansia aciculifera]|nr:NADH-cytochrome b5 reductase [Coemansia aciculifera]